MQIGREIGGLSWEDVTLLRKAMSRSLGKEYFDQFGDRWKAGARRHMDIPAPKLDQFWADLCQFGQWAFNRSHSVAYSVVTYWSLWLKAHHPVEYAAATLDAEAEPKRQVSVLREMREEGIGYIPVDVDLSTDRWEVKTSGGHQFLVGPLQNVHGLGPVAVRNILDVRRGKLDATGKRVQLTPAMSKRLAGAQTSLSSLEPISDAIKRLHPDLTKIGIETRASPIGGIEGADQEVLILARVAKVAPLNENEPARVARRGRRLDEPTDALNLFMEDDTAQIFCKVDRWLFPSVGRELVAQAKVNKSLYAVKGTVPSDFRMIRVSRIKYLGEMGQNNVREGASAPQPDGVEAEKPPRSGGTTIGDHLMAKKEVKAVAKVAKKSTNGKAATNGAAPRPKFGSDVRISALPAENPRRKGTKNYVRFDELQKFMKKKPQATVADVIAGTTYRRNDFEWDLEKGVFKTARA